MASEAPSMEVDENISITTKQVLNLFLYAIESLEKMQFCSRWFLEKTF